MGGTRLLFKWAVVLMCTSMLRSTVINTALLGDFMSGGTDFFGALLAILADLDMCAMNGSFLVMFIVWSCWSVFSDVVSSLLPNLLHSSIYADRMGYLALDGVLICA